MGWKRLGQHFFIAIVLQELLLIGAISEVPHSTWFYSKYSIVPKKDGGQLPVLDLWPETNF